MSQQRKRVAILGATGYGGGELLRLLLQHPLVEVRYATSRSQSGPVHAVHKNLRGFTELEFSNPSHDELVENCDVIFGALPHKSAAEVLAPFVDAGKIVIDLSGDFRLRDLAQYKRWYKHDHPRQDLLAKAVYGIPELNREKIRTANLVASPGCFATAINLALLPAAKAGLLTGNVHVVAMTGSSGSGAEASSGTHHPTRAGTLRPYKVLSHQHVPECVQLCGDAGSRIDGISFVPVSAPLVRGILSIATAELSKSITTADAEKLFADAYAKEPYVKVITDREPECGPVAGTNYAEVRARVSEDGKLVAICAVDNLIKGGAGQAVQSLNIMLGCEDSAPLNWPGMWP
jgi:N-acetyl-gamma-glutamyl-phosphate reductase